MKTCYIIDRWKRAAYKCKAITVPHGYQLQDGPNKGFMCSTIHETLDSAKTNMIKTLTKDKNSILASINEQIKSVELDIKNIKSINKTTEYVAPTISYTNTTDWTPITFQNSSGSRTIRWGARAEPTPAPIQPLTAIIND